MKTTRQSIEDYVAWCREQALPYWAKCGVDPKGGGYERLHMDGAPDTTSTRRVRVQARQAFTYALAGARGWCVNAKQTSDYHWAFMLEKGFQSIDDTGLCGCVHLLNMDGTLKEDYYDTYAQAFVILAGAWRYMAFKDEASLGLAKNVLSCLNTHVKADNGGWLEGVPASLPRRQNPHMHLFESMLAMYDATNDPDYMKQADDIYALFSKHFFDTETATIIEFFNQDWTRAQNNGGPVEPGHMMEWSWLLIQYQIRSGKNILPQAVALYESALTHGLDEVIGLVSDFAMSSGDEKTFRSWPQTEYVKASLALAGITGQDNYAANAAQALDNMKANYLSVPQSGGWADKVDIKGAPMTKYMEASTFYHLISAAAQAEDFLKT